MTKPKPKETPSPDAAEAARKLARRDEIRREWRAFAFAYSDPSSPGFRDGARAVCIAYAVPGDPGKLTIKSPPRQQAYQLLRKPYVQAVIAQIQERIKASAEITNLEYVQLLLEREKWFTMRGMPGDAAAAAKILHDIGVASGLLVQRIDAKVDIPNMPSADAIVQSVIEAGRRLERLNQPNPIALPQGTATVDNQPVEAELIEDAGSK